MVVIFIFDFTKLFHRKKGFIMTASFVKLFGVDAAVSDTVAVHLLTSSAVFCKSVNTVQYSTVQCTWAAPGAVGEAVRVVGAAVQRVAGVPPAAQLRHVGHAQRHLDQSEVSMRSRDQVSTNHSSPWPASPCPACGSTRAPRAAPAAADCWYLRQHGNG